WQCAGHLLGGRRWLGHLCGDFSTMLKNPAFCHSVSGHAHADRPSPKSAVAGGCLIVSSDLSWRKEIPMPSILTRTTMLVFGLWLLNCGAAQASCSQGVTDAFVEQLAGLEQQAGGRLGVVLLDTANGRQWSYRGDERFALCSTFKVLLPAAVLRAVDEGQLTLDQPVVYGPEDLQEYGPVTRQHVGDGQMTVGALAAAAVEYSDN